MTEKDLLRAIERDCGVPTDIALAISRKVHRAYLEGQQEGMGESDDVLRRS